MKAKQAATVERILRSESLDAGVLLQIDSIAQRRFHESRSERSRLELQMVAELRHWMDLPGQNDPSQRLGARFLTDAELRAVENAALQNYPEDGYAQRSAREIAMVNQIRLFREGAARALERTLACLTQNPISGQGRDGR